MSQEVSTSSSTNNTTYPLPSTAALQHLVRLSIGEDLPIKMDYWVGSCDKEVVLGRNEETGHKLLVRNSDEYTSRIVRLFLIEREYIIITENSIYLVSADIPKKRIS